MTRQILFIQGAGEGAYKADTLLAQDLQKKLGSEFKVICPKMPNEANAPYILWKQQIQEEIALMQGPIIFVGHSMGASELMKILTDIKTDAMIAGIFLLATPFWGGEGWIYEGYEELELPHDTSAKLQKDTKVFLYHARDDEIVPFNHMTYYAKLLPQATVREIITGGHQFNNDLSLIATDIKAMG